MAENKGIDLNLGLVEAYKRVAKVLKHSSARKKKHWKGRRKSIK